MNIDAVIGFICGLFAGSFIGVCIMALMIAAGESRGDDE